MKCKFEHIFNTNSISEFLPPFHEASRMFFDIFIHYVWSLIPSNFRTVRQEIIWGNQHIKFKNKSLIYLNWINDGIIFEFSFI
jgi:hypothetical protein